MRVYSHPLAEAHCIRVNKALLVIVAFSLGYNMTSLLNHIEPKSYQQCKSPERPLILFRDRQCEQPCTACAPLSSEAIYEDLTAKLGFWSADESKFITGLGSQIKGTDNRRRFDLSVTGGRMVVVMLTTIARLDEFGCIPPF